jgi:hypothetical protein
MKLYCLVDGDEFVTHGLVPRARWRKGPWDDEPEDQVYWIDPKTKLDCLALRNAFGEWCGYVGVPRASKYYGEDKSGTLLLGISACEVAYASSSSEDEARVRDFLKGRPEIVWWIGFDTGGLHSKDLNYMRPRITELAEELAEG